MPLQILAEKTRQKLGGVSSSSAFQHISLERYQHALADADKFAAWLQDYHGTASQLQAALQGFLGATSTAVSTCPLPYLYSERYDTHELRALPHPPPPKGYSHLFNPSEASGASPTAAAAAPLAPAGDDSPSDPLSRVTGLPAAFPDKFEGHVMVPIELWLQAHKEAQARLSALDRLRVRVDSQRLKLHKQGQIYEQRRQERKQRSHSGSASARSSFERSPAAHFTAASAAASAANATAGTTADRRPQQTFSNSQAANKASFPPNLAAAAAAALASRPDLFDTPTTMISSNDDSMGSEYKSTAADAGLLTTPPCTPMVSAANLAAGFEPQQLPSRNTTAAAAAAAAARANESEAHSASSSVDEYADDLVRLKSFPLVDIPTSVASSSNSRQHTAERNVVEGTPTAAAAAAAASPKQPTVHAALPVPAAGGASASPLRSAAAAAAAAAAPTTPAAAGTAARDGGTTGCMASRDVPATYADSADSVGQSDRGMRLSEDSIAGLDEDDLESWAAAVLHKRGEQGLLQAHEMVERALGPLLSEFSKAEMQLSLLLGWLVTQAVRLRGYLAHILLTSDSQVTTWGPPPGLLEPFPADVLLTGDGHHHSHHKSQSSKHAARAAASAAGATVDSSVGSVDSMDSVQHAPVAPPAPLPELPLTPQQLLPKQLPTPHTSSATRPQQQRDTVAHSTTHHVDAPSTRPPYQTATSGSQAAAPAVHAPAVQPRAVQPPAVQPTAVQPTAVQPTAVHTQPGGTTRSSFDLHASSTTVLQGTVVPTSASDATQADGYKGTVSQAVTPPSTVDTAHADSANSHKGPGGSPIRQTLPKPASSSALSVGTAMLAAMVRSLSWKSSGNSDKLGVGRASRASSGSSGAKDVLNHSPSRRSSKDVLHSVNVQQAVPKGVPLGEGVVAVSPRGDATANQGSQADDSMLQAPVGDMTAGVESSGIMSSGGDSSGVESSRVMSAGVESSGVSAAPGVSTADMTYLAQDRALIESLSEQVLCEPCISAAAASSGATVAAPAGDEHSSYTETTGASGTTHRAGMGDLSASAAEGGDRSAVQSVAGSHGVGSSVSQGIVYESGFGASQQLGHRRQQLLQRAAELDAESAQHAAAAKEAGRMAAAYDVEGSEWEMSLKSEVVVERRRLQERLEAVTMQLSEVQSSEVPRFRSAAAHLTTQLADLHQQMSALASQETEAGELHSGLLSRRAAATSALTELDLKRDSLQAKMTSAKSVLSSKYEVARALEVEVSRLQELLTAAEARRSEAQEGLADRQAKVDAGAAELSDTETRLDESRVKLTHLLEVELVQLQQEMKDIQVRLHEVQSSEHRAQANADLQDLTKQLQQDSEKMAHWESTCLQMSSRLSELTSRSETLSCEVATFNAQAVAARGLAGAEETRAAAAGAEAQALKAAAAAMKSSQESWAASNLTTSTTSLTGTSHTTASSTATTRSQHTAAVAAEDAAAVKHSSGSGSAGIINTGSAAPSADALAGAVAAAGAAGDEGVSTDASVPNRLAAAGPLQQVSSPTAATAAVTSDDVAQQEQLSSATAGHSVTDSATMTDSATQTTRADVTAPATAEGHVFGTQTRWHWADAVTGDAQSSSGKAEAQTVPAAETATHTPGAGETAAPAAPTAAAPLRDVPAAAAGTGARQADSTSTVLASGTREAGPADSTRPHIVPGSRAHVVSDTVPHVQPVVGSSARAAATTVPPAVTAAQAPPEISPATPSAARIVSSTNGSASASAAAGPSTTAAAAAARPELTSGVVPTTSHSLGAAGVGSSSGLQQSVGVVSPGSVGSVGSSSRGHKHKSWLKHFKVQKARPEDHFYLPLGGMDVDIGHMTDQTTSTPTHLTAPPTALPAALPTTALALTPAAGPLAGRPAAAQQPGAATMVYAQAPSAMTSPQYAAYSRSSSGPLGGREPRRNSRGSVDVTGPGAGTDRLSGPGGPVSGPLSGPAAGPGTQLKLVVGAAPAGAELQGLSGGAAHQDQGASSGRAHKGHKHRRKHRAGEGNGVMGGGLGGEGVTQAERHVPGPLEAAGGGWQQDRSYEGYGRRGY